MPSEKNEYRRIAGKGPGADTARIQIAAAARATPARAGVSITTIGDDFFLVLENGDLIECPYRAIEDLLDASEALTRSEEPK